MQARGVTMDDSSGKAAAALADQPDGSGSLDGLGLFYEKRTVGDAAYLAFADMNAASSWQTLAVTLAGVGAAALVSDGRVVAGCNVENAGYGVTLCAECGLVSDLVLGGGGRLIAFTCCNGDGAVIMPCGRCRSATATRTCGPTWTRW